MMVPVPKKPLSQVVFVEDYFQLVFQDERFSFYNVVELANEQRVVDCGQQGFCDALIGLIGEQVTSVTVGIDSELTVQFSSGSVLRTHVGSSGACPEAWQFNGSDGQIVVSMV